jgi:uncharacterized protein YjbI with pentapeptide repeats
MSIIQTCKGNIEYAIRNAIIKKKSFKGCTIKDQELKKKNFDGCNFSNTNIHNTYLEQSIFTECSFEDSKINSSDLMNSKFTYTGKNNLKNTTFEKTELFGVEFKELILLKTKFIDVEADYTVFKDSTIEKVIFKNSTFVGADFKDATFRGLDFKDCNFEDADFEGVSLVSADEPDVKIVGGNFSNANFKRASMLESSFTNVNLTHINFEDSDLRWTSFIDCDLTDAIFKNANLNYTTFKRCKMTDVNLKDIDLTDTIFDDTKLDTRILSILENISPTFKEIPHNQTALDLIEGDVEMTSFLTENKNVFAFLYQKNYYLLDKNDLYNIIDITNDNNSIVYECKEDSGDTSSKNIIRKTLLIKLGSLGIPINRSYIPIQYFKNITKNDNITNINDRIYEIVRTTREVASVISHQIYVGISDDLSSSSHCQKEQGGYLYKLQKIKNAGKIVQNVIRSVAITKKNRKTAKPKTATIATQTATQTKKNKQPKITARKNETRVQPKMTTFYTRK